MVEVCYKGALGNKLFQYSLGRIIAEQLKFSLKAEPIPGFPHTYDKIAGLDYSNYPVQEFTGQELDLAGILRDKSKRKILLNGYFQFYKYYRPYKETIRNKWLLMQRDCHEGNIGITEQDIAIVIRLNEFFYLYSIEMHPYSYYQEALSCTKYNRIYICSDEKENPYLRRFKKYHPIIVYKSPLEQFKFITSFNKIIVSASSFIWWAAFLSKAEEVYYPLPPKGCWAQVDLFVNDEIRYLPIKYREVYRPNLRESYAIYKSFFERNVTKLWNKIRRSRQR